MAAIVISIVSNLTKYLVDPTINEARYLFCVGKIIEDLETQKKELLIRQKRVQKRVEEALSKTHEIEDAVEKWLDAVKDLITNVEKLQQDLMANKGCFGGWCPTVERYCLCKQLAQKTKTMTELNKTSEINPFSHPASIPDIEHFSSREFLLFDCTKSAFEKVLEALQEDNCYMIGLYGMGGSGKTTLVKELGKKAKKEKRFDRVAFTTVSQIPDIRKIQGEIADLLGVKFEEETEPGRARRIALKLGREERILIILDDIWAKINLEDIGIPWDGHGNRCKVLLTTRLPSVCESMNCQKLIPLGLLSQGEAWALFQQHARTNDETRARGKDISKECKGLPIALVAVGNSLKGKGIDEMNVALDKLTHSKRVDVNKGDRDAFTCLQFSYDYLQSKEAKSLFLMCAMFPEDYDISREDLFRYGKGLGLCGEMDSFGTARSQVNALINNLIDSSLLTNSEHKDDHFKMHDVVRDVALWRGSKPDCNIMVNPTTEYELKKDWQAVWYGKLGHFPHQQNVSKLKSLVPNLGEERHLSFALFEDIQGLKVIALEGRDGLYQLSMIQSMQWLANLQTLRLVGLELGDNISFVASLRRLEILDLHRSTFKELPDGLKELSKLKLLDLSNCRGIKEAFGVIERCSQLQELYALSSYENTEVPWECLNSDTFPKLERYQVKFGPFPQPQFHPFRVLSSKWLELGRFNVSTSGAAVKDLLQRADRVCFYDLQGVCKYIFPEMDRAAGGMNALTDLELVECKEIECLVNTVASQASSSGGLCMPIPLCPKSSYLKRLKISECPKLTTLFPMSVAQTLMELQELEIFDCEELEEIFKGSENSPNPSLSLPKLVVFEVKQCNKLKTIFNFVADISMPSLDTLIISKCEELGEIFKGNENSPNPPLSLLKLVVFEVKQCNKLKTIFNSVADMSMPSLDRLIISKCEELEEIFKGNENSPNPSLSLPKLVVFEFKQCNKLKTIFNSFADMSMPSLDRLNISECEELEEIFKWKENSPNPSLSLPKLVVFELKQCNKLKIIFNSVADISMPSLDRLIISECEELEEIFKGKENSPNPSLSLPKLVVFEFKQCNKLKTIFNSVADISMPSLDRLIIFECEELAEIFKGKENSPNPSLSLPKLIAFELKQCNKLKTIFNSVADISMPSLDRLIISECEELEEIFKGKENSPNPSLSLPKLVVFELKQCNKLKTIFNSVADMSMPSLDRVIISECEELEEIFKGNESSPNPSLSLPTLVVFEVRQCNKLKTIFNSVADISMPSLDRVIISECEELEEIFKGKENSPNPSLSLPKLVVFEVKQCNKLKTIFNSVADISMPSLDRLIISKCEELEEIFKGKENSPNPSLSLPKLVVFEVKQCNKVKTIFNSVADISMPSLDRLIISECEELEEIFKGKENSPNLSLSLPKLIVFEVRQCNKLKTIFNSVTDISMPSLDRLIIFECEELEEIFKGKENSPNPSLSLPKLVVFELKQCNKLKTIFNSVADMSMPSLDRVIISECEELEEIFKGNESSPNPSLSLPKLVVFEVRQCNKLKTIFNSVANLSMPSLDRLILSECEELEEIFKGKENSPNPSLSLPKLVVFEVKQCNKVKTIFNSFADMSMPSLDRLIISKCEELEEIFKGNEKSPNPSLSLPKLVVFEVKQCNKVKTIFNSVADISMPSLDRVIISECEELEEIFKGNENSPNPSLSLPKQVVFEVKQCNKFSSGTF